MDPEAIHIVSPQQAPEEKVNPFSKLPKPKKPSPLVVILVLIAAIALTATFYFANQIKNLKKEPSQYPQLQTSSGQANDPTANWKTYSNSELGFSLQYPSSFIVDKQLNDEYNRYVAFRDDLSSFEVKLRYESRITFNIPLALDEYYFLDTKPIDKTEIDGEPANIHKSKTGYCDGPSCTEPYVAIVAKRGTSFYHLIFYGDDSLSETESKILTSFKFIDVE